MKLAAKLSLATATLVALLAVTGATRSDAVAIAPNVVEGTVTTANGKPVAGATIRVSGATGAARGTTRKATTDANGRYRLEVPLGHYNVDGFADIEFNGQTYKELWLDRGNATCERVMSDKGIVRNFVLRLSGPKRCINGFTGDNPGDYHGAYIAINTDAFPGNSIITFALVPNGPLADGSTGKTITFKRTGAALARGGGAIGQTGFLHDIPLGRYRMTANVTYADGQQRGTLLTLQDGTGRTASTLDISFPANVFGGGIRPLNVGVKAGGAARPAVEDVTPAPTPSRPPVEKPSIRATSSADLPSGRYTCSYRSPYAGEIPTGKTITILGRGRYEAFDSSGSYNMSSSGAVAWTSGPLAGSGVKVSFSKLDGQPVITVIGGPAKDDPDSTNTCVLR
ncbi:MAG TPA: carboxypeptidase-like regulatory domain-containing protein [Gemmatimonadaceae bacterium]